MTLAEKEAADEVLFHAALQREAIAPLSESWPALTIDDAYHIQLINHQRQLANGARRVGCKIGLTAPAVQQQLGVDQPDFGVLFNTMCYGDAEPIPASKLTQPKVEAEIAFVFKDELAMDEPTLHDVIRAIDYALPAIEVVGSRIRNWDIRIVDTIADNASSGVFVLGGTPKLLSDFDLRLCGMVMTRRGEPVSTGAGSACLGHPLNAVVWLARTMARVGTPLKAGDIVLSGALGPMVSVSAGDTIEARINGLGSVRACFSPAADEEAA